MQLWLLSLLKEELWHIFTFKGRGEAGNVERSSGHHCWPQQISQRGDKNLQELSFQLSTLSRIVSIVSVVTIVKNDQILSKLLKIVKKN